MVKQEDARVWNFEDYFSLFSQLSLDLGHALGERQLRSLSSYAQLVSSENQRQNLTRLISPEDFYFGHIVDAIELKGLEWINMSTGFCDIGSGSGSPMIPFLLLNTENSLKSVFYESEKMKANFIEGALSFLDIGRDSKVFPVRFEGRAELPNGIDTVSCRALGPLDRILFLLSKCSTWNSLILFKGPNFDEELDRTPKHLLKAIKLSQMDRHEYSNQGKRRVLIRIKRST